LKIKTRDFKSGIFDVDGTVIDDKQLYRKTISALVKLGLRVRPQSELYLPTGGIPLPRLAKQLCQSHFLTWLAKKTDTNLLKLCTIIDKRELRLIDGAKETLDQLFKNGIKLFASTGGETHKAENSLQKLGMFHFFTKILGSDQAPKKEHFNRFAKYLNLPLKEFARQSFLVSDGPVDLTLAIECGIHSIGITNTLSSNSLLEAGAIEVISNLRELLL